MGNITYPRITDEFVLQVGVKAPLLGKETQWV